MPFRSSSAALSGALSLSGTVLGGLALGALIGHRWDWNPQAAAIGLFVGILAGFYNLAKAMWAQK